MHFHRCCEPSRESRSSFVSTEIDKRVLPSFPPPRPLSASPSHDSRRCVCKHVHEYLDICPANWALQIFTFCTRAKFGCFFVYCLHSERANKLVTTSAKRWRTMSQEQHHLWFSPEQCIALNWSNFTYDTIAFPFPFPTQKLVLWQGAEPILHFRCLEVSYDWGKKSFNQEDWTPLCAKVWCSRWENGCASLASFHRSRKGQRRVKDGEIGQHNAHCLLPSMGHRVHAVERYSNVSRYMYTRYMYVHYIDICKLDIWQGVTKT